MDRLYKQLFIARGILLLLVLSAETNKNCDNALCHSEGICMRSNDGSGTSCNCIGKRHFKGEHCEQQIDNCQPNPCRNGAKCTNVLGAYICAPCAAGYAGMQCSIEQANCFTKYYLHYHTLVEYGKPHQFLITMETLGTTAFVLEFFASNYQIEAFTTFSSDPMHKFKWKKSQNLRGIAHNLHMRHPELLPYNNGYYYAFSGTFWNVGETELTLIILDLETGNLILDFIYVLHVSKPKELSCVLQMHIPRCSNPREMLHIDMARFNNFEVEIQQHCDDTSIRYHWRIYTTLGTTLLHDFGTDVGSDKKTLKTRPYLFWFNVQTEALQVYSVQVEAHEINAGRKNPIGTIARCYVFIMPKPVLADIAGGSRREINVAKSLVLDGTASRDYALAPNVPQDMDYVWDCKPVTDASEGANFCHKKMSQSKKFVVPANTLIAGHSYEVALTVRSHVNIYTKRTFKQTVVAVADQRLPLYISITCVRNCERAKFNAAQRLHLKANCIDCPGGNDEAQVTYEWQAGGQQVGKRQRLLYTPTAAKRLSVKITVKNGEGRVGVATIELTQNKLPTGGRCTIKPTSGKAYNTSFQLTCSDFTDPDDDVPLLYTYTVKNAGAAKGAVASSWTIVRTTETEITVRLPQAEGVQVSICDNLNGCINKAIAVSVAPLDVAKTNDVAALKDFFQQQQPSNDLHALIAYDSSTSYMLLIYILLQHVTSLPYATAVYHQMQHLVLYTLLEVEQMLLIIGNAIGHLQLQDYHVAKFYTQLLMKFADGFTFVLRDGEIAELPEINYTPFTQEFATVFATFSKTLDDIPPPTQIENVTTTIMRKPNDLLAENYAPMPPFDVTVLERIEAWLQASRVLHRCLHLFGLAEAHLQEPDERLDLTAGSDPKKQLQLTAYSIENSREQRIDNDTIEIIISSQLLQQLQNDLNDRQLLLQIVFMHDQNPFWWHPNEIPLATKVFYVDIHTKSPPTGPSSASKSNLMQPIDFSVPITTNATTTPLAIQRQLTSPLDMPIYSVTLPANALLIVVFKPCAVATLRVGLRLEMKPRSCQVRRSNQIVGATTATTFSLLNTKCNETTAYIAILMDPSSSKGSAAPIEFTLTIRECISFIFDDNYLGDPQWTSRGGCKPSMAGQTEARLQCNCHHMSAFAGRKYEVPANAARGDNRLLEYVPINWYMIAFYMELLLILVLLMCHAYHTGAAKPRREQLLIELREEDAQKQCNILISFTTGNDNMSTLLSSPASQSSQPPMSSYGTTSNVLLTVLLVNQPARRFVIYQNPKNPALRTNSTCTVRLPLNGNELILPLQFYISIDGSGRYPSWCLRCIDVHDVQLQKSYHFIASQCLHQHVIMKLHSMADEYPTTKYWLQQRFHDFICTIVQLFNQWYMWQPFVGVTQGMLLFNYGTIDRFDRCCIWLVKFMLNITVIACSFHSTTLDTYEMERDQFRSVSITPTIVLMLCAICFLINVLTHYGLLFLLFFGKYNRLKNMQTKSVL